MQCPVDGATLLISDRNGVEIDYCPTCRGVWLDRGELDKIIERSAVPQMPQRAGDRPGGTDLGGGDRPHKKKRGGFLEDLFDF